MNRNHIHCEFLWDVQFKYKVIGYLLTPYLPKSNNEHERVDKSQLFNKLRFLLPNKHRSQ